ncbi:MAG: GNAT family N-acetyltransferase [Desulfobacterales bacterium]|nr:MAG: GNAT family N-acetyltransferase [Desulfobacterales bacterium]
MDIPIQYRRMKHGEESQVSAFVSGVFHQFVSPEFSQQGIEEFMKYIQPDALDSQLKGNHFALIATLGSEIIGVIEVRDCNHVALFFVDPRFQRMGIGNELFRKATEICKQQVVNLSEMTVNASPNSVTAYEKLGFKPADIEQCVNGIRFVPMALRLQQVAGG